MMYCNVYNLFYYLSTNPTYLKQRGGTERIFQDNRETRWIRQQSQSQFRCVDFVLSRRPHSFLKSVVFVSNLESKNEKKLC